MCCNSLIINVLLFCFYLSFVIVLCLARNRVFCKVSNFYHHFFVFYFFFRNFALVKRFVNTYNGVDMMHKEMYFSVFFNVICLEVSNILLTHTHTHLTQVAPKVMPAIGFEGNCSSAAICWPANKMQWNGL